MNVTANTSVMKPLLSRHIARQRGVTSPGPVEPYFFAVFASIMMLVLRAGLLSDGEPLCGSAGCSNSTRLASGRRHRTLPELSAS